MGIGKAPRNRAGLPPLWFGIIGLAEPAAKSVVLDPLPFAQIPSCTNGVRQAANSKLGRELINALIIGRPKSALGELRKSFQTGIGSVLRQYRTFFVGELAW
jgi:hypothetical protein